MKRVIIAVVLLAVLLLFCIWAYAYLDRHTAALAQTIDEAEQAVRAADFTGAASRMAQSYAAWTRLCSTLGALVRHNEIDAIETLYVRAQQAVDSQNANDALLETAELRALLLHLAEMEAPSFANLF